MVVTLITAHNDCQVTLRDGQSRIGATRVPLTNYFVNTILTALQAPEWEGLLQGFKLFSPVVLVYMLIAVLALARMLCSIYSPRRPFLSRSLMVAFVK